jgi:hypothetical protein
MTYLTTDPRVPQVCAALRGQWLHNGRKPNAEDISAQCAKLTAPRFSQLEVEALVLEEFGLLDCEID